MAMGDGSKTGFWSGFAAGVAATAGLAQWIFAALVMPSLKKGFGDFRAELPFLTRLATSAAWSFGVPAAVIVAAIWTAGRKNARVQLTISISIAVAAVAAFAFTYWATYRPFFELAPLIE